MNFSTISLKFVDFEGTFTDIIVLITNQNEVITDFKKLCRSEPDYVYETSQSINFIEFYQHN